MLQKKPWYKRKRYWAGGLLLLAVYFCLIPSPLRISSRTTGISGPLDDRGKVDYFAAFEKLYIDKLNPPEDNGLRLLIAACGPRILEMSRIAETVPWEELPMHEKSKQWFADTWLPLCEHMSIDPNIKPPFYDSANYYSFMRKHRESSQAGDETLSKYEKKIDPAEELRIQLIAAPWKAEEHPVVADWLRERSLCLDYFGLCVRKPNYVCWRPRPKEDGLISIVLSDVQSHREFAKDLHVRITERLGRGDVEGAWYDLMSLMILARRHLRNDPILVTQLIGRVIEDMAEATIPMFFQYGSLSKEQIERFSREWDSLPQPNSFRKCLEFESYVLYEILRSRTPLKYFNMLQSLSGKGKGPKFQPPILAAEFLLPIDLNIAGERLTELVGPLTQNQEVWENRVLRQKAVQKNAERLSEMMNRLYHTGNILLRLPLIRTRSELIADFLFSSCSPGISEINNANNRTDARYELVRIAWALERYKADHGDYPETLEPLWFGYLEEIPLDPCTNRSTLTYKPRPEDGCEYLLYSFGSDGKDDGGEENENNRKGDIAFVRRTAGEVGSGE